MSMEPPPQQCSWQLDKLTVIIIITIIAIIEIIVLGMGEVGVEGTCTQMEPTTWGNSVQEH